MSTCSRKIKSDLITNLKSHKCNLCEKCLVCHHCLLARGYLRDGLKEPKARQNSNYEVHLDTILEAILKSQAEEEPPRYILVGPNNEIVESNSNVLSSTSDDQTKVVQDNGILPVDQEEIIQDNGTLSRVDQEEIIPDFDIHSLGDQEELAQVFEIYPPVDQGEILAADDQGDILLPPVVEPVSLDCDVCQKTFTSEKDLNVHKIYHSVEEVFQCKICSMTFKYSYELIKHELYHDNKFFYCEYCKRSYLTEEKLYIHMRVHTGSKPFVCHVCERGFKENVTLKKHLMIHLDERPFKCETCGRSFRDALKLKRHNWIHEGIKPFTCFVCERAFRHKCNLKSHLLRHHNMTMDSSVVEEEIVTEELSLV